MSPRSLGLLPVVLLACGQGGPPAASDALRYHEAVGRADPDACGAIVDPGLRSECVAFAAAELTMAGRHDEAQTTCESIAAGPWRDECFFELADTVSAEGGEARELCAQAGAFADRCLSHAFGREASVIMAAMTPGTEAESLARVQEVGRRYYDDQRAVRDSEGYVAAALSQRLGPAPLSRSDCGTASDRLCAAAYRARVTLPGGPGTPPTDGDVLRVICQGGATAATVADAGLLSWTADFDELAADVWQGLCAQGRRPQGIAWPGGLPPKGTPAPR